MKTSRRNTLIALTFLLGFTILFTGCGGSSSAPGNYGKFDMTGYPNGQGGGTVIENMTASEIQTFSTTYCDGGPEFASEFSKLQDWCVQQNLECVGILERIFEDMSWMDDVNNCGNDESCRDHILNRLIHRDTKCKMFFPSGSPIPTEPAVAQGDHSGTRFVVFLDSYRPETNVNGPVLNFSYEDWKNGQIPNFPHVPSAEAIAAVDAHAGKLIDYVWGGGYNSFLNVYLADGRRIGYWDHVTFFEYLALSNAN